MKLVPAAIAVLAAMLPLSAPVPGLAAAPALQVADNGDFASRKADYESGARREMDLWQRRMSEAGARTQKELDQAWAVTKEQWAELQQATAEGWDRSRAAFEQATGELEAKWHEYQSND